MLNMGFINALVVEEADSQNIRQLVTVHGGRPDCSISTHFRYKGFRCLRVFPSR